MSRQIVDFMRAHGWRAVRMQSGLMGRPEGGAFRIGEVGMPDWLFVRYRERPLAEVVWVEVKAPGKRATDHQTLWHEAERAQGALVFCVDSFERFEEEYSNAGLL